MALDNNKAEFEIAFFVVRQTSDLQGYIGAVLVTDSRGIPIEFNCTHPVRPTTVQKALYGKNLDTFVSFELCGGPLLNALKSTPGSCLVESSEMVGLRDVVSLPVVYVQRLGDVLTAQSDDPASERGAGAPNSQINRLDSRHGGFQPIAVHSHHGYESDVEEARPLLEHVFQNVDLLEPFERITSALVTLSERDERFR